jgi:hypothetical protein
MIIIILNKTNEKQHNTEINFFMLNIKKYKK